MSSQVATVGLFKQILQHFPARHMRMAFAYGSGVFQQEGHKDMSKNMVDFIFVVDKPCEWHEQNLICNSAHYSFLRLLGARKLTQIQENFGAKIYFNTLVPCEGRIIKYGIISTGSLIDDLLDWDTLYVSGRLHKPVNVVHHEEMADLTAALSANHRSAVHSALLILSDTFTEEEFFHTITGLSYSGDIRMTVGEDKNKVANIVKPNLSRLRTQYESILDQNDSHLYWNKSKGIFEQNLSPASRFHHLNLLPKMLQIRMVAERNKDGRLRDTEEVIHNLAHDVTCSDIIHHCVSQIVQKSSLTQSLKGVLTAGCNKTAKYSYAKLQKMLASQAKPP